jgi:hypothetical protein
MKRAIFIASVIAVTVAAPAEAAPTVIAEVDRNLVGVGETIRYSLTIRSSESITVGSVSAGNVDGFEVTGKQSSQSSTWMQQNGQFVDVATFTVTFMLRATKVGVHKLGPGRVLISGKAVNTPVQKVEVVAAGKKPRNPLEDFDDEPTPTPAPIAPTDPLAAVDTPPTDPDKRMFFTRLVPSSKTAIVGEQVTLKLFVYARDPPKVFVKRPPVLPDFRHIPLGGVDKMWQKITIGDETWLYGTLEAFAAFPLRAGKLPIGPSIVETIRDLAFGKADQRDIESPDTEVEAVEPPAEGRPPGYVLGDVVADLTVEADVAPRIVTDGHALVTLRMKGAGRLDPLRPQLSSPPAVTWTNTGDETKTRVDALTVVGERKLQIDAKFDRTGDLELGDAVVHVWDPKRKGYVSARSPLGKVRVNRAAETQALPGVAAPAALPPPRGAVGPSGEGASLADRPWTWSIVAGAPLAVVLAQLATSFARRRKQRAEALAIDPAEQARRALLEAKGDPIVASTRALDRAVEARTGVRPRGLTRSELARALRATELEASLVDALLKAFDELESARFAGGSAPSIDEVRALVERVLTR